MDEVLEVRTAAPNDMALFGTIESWIIWWLTGGPNDKRGSVIGKRQSRDHLIG